MAKDKFLQLKPHNPLKTSNLLKIAFIYLLALVVFGFGQGTKILTSTPTIQKVANQ